MIFNISICLISSLIIIKLQNHKANPTTSSVTINSNNKNYLIKKERQFNTKMQLCIILNEEIKNKPVNETDKFSTMN